MEWRTQLESDAGIIFISPQLRANLNSLILLDLDYCIMFAYHQYVLKQDGYLYLVQI